jgi:DNA-binding GntR family transcriptional regulator
MCSTRYGDDQVHIGGSGVGEQTGLPEYRRVMNDLRRQIANDVLPLGESIPSTADLMEEYGVSVTVVRRAVAELKGEGLLRGQPGKAVYVLAKPSDSASAHTPEYEAIMGEIRALRGEMQSLARRLGHLEDSVGPQ